MRLAESAPSDGTTYHDYRAQQGKEKLFQCIVIQVDSSNQRASPVYSVSSLPYLLRYRLRDLHYITYIINILYYPQTELEEVDPELESMVFAEPRI